MRTYLSCNTNLVDGILWNMRLESGCMCAAVNAVAEYACQIFSIPPTFSPKKKKKKRKQELWY